MLHFRLNTEQRHVLHVFSVSLYFDFFFLKETFGQLDTAALFQSSLLLFSEKLLPILSLCHFQRVGKHIQDKALAKWRYNEKAK